MKSSDRAVAICCRTDQAFSGAHRSAIARRRPSLLVPQADWRRLAELESDFGPIEVLTDDPENRHFAPFHRIAVSAIGNAPAIPRVEKWPDPVAILLTSGTTGVPKAIAKTPAAVVGESEALQRALGSGISSATFVTMVPYEHMFGYTFAFWLPRLSGARTHGAKASTPSEVKALSENLRSPLWVVTTPALLRACVEVGHRLHTIAGVISATSPLSSALARAAASCFGVPITEIYGSTETGAMAIRQRHANEIFEPPWSPLPGVLVRARPDGSAEFCAGYLERPVVLSDHLGFDGDGFRILGRDDDLVKVGGKRHSLAALNLILTETPGVRDGAYYFPTDDVRAEFARAIAFVVLDPGISTASVVEALRGRIDNVFLPRPLFSVAELPRTGTGKLTRQALGELYPTCVARCPLERNRDA